MGVNFVHISMACGQKFPKPPLIRPQALYVPFLVRLHFDSKGGGLNGYVNSERRTTGGLVIPGTWEDMELTRPDFGLTRVDSGLTWPDTALYNQNTTLHGRDAAPCAYVV